ncbi:MAG: hypothetical protein RLY21_1952 [Planctomycetota bacterium]|jgi:hypothetical protein
MPAAPRAKLIFWTIVSFFAVAFVAAAFWSWSIVGNVRQQAAVTDARLRELAWAVLAYADRNDGFPTSEAELRAFVGEPAVLPEALEKKPLAIEGRVYPMTRAEAGAPETLASLDLVFTSIEVEWPIERDVQPILRPRGLPTLQGTGSTVGDWLFAMTERLRAQ